MALGRPAPRRRLHGPRRRAGAAAAADVAVLLRCARHLVVGGPVTGYVEGPTLAPDEAPWRILWESSVDEGCAHQWERVTVPSLRWRLEESVIRCATCHVPRCGHSTDRDPCMERRHHDGVHIYLSGAFEPLGGVLGVE